MKCNIIVMAIFLKVASVLTSPIELHQGHLAKRAAPFDMMGKQNLDRPSVTRPRYEDDNNDYDQNMRTKRDESKVMTINIEDTQINIAKRSAQKNPFEQTIVARPRYQDKSKDYDQHTLAKRDQSKEESIDVEDVQIVKRDAQFRRNDEQPFIYKPRYQDKSKDYDQHTLAKRDQSKEESVDVEDVQIVKRDAQFRRNDEQPFISKPRYQDKSKDYDQHTLAKRDQSKEESVDVEDVQIVKRDAQFMRNDEQPFISKPRYQDKSKDYDQHTLAKRDQSKEESIDVEDTPVIVTKKAIFPDTSKVLRFHHLKMLNDRIEHMMARREMQSNEETSDYDHINESRNPKLETSRSSFAKRDISTII